MSDAPLHDTGRERSDDRRSGDGPQDDRDTTHSEHPLLEAFNAEEVVEAPGHLDEEASPTADADIQPPQ